MLQNGSMTIPEVTTSSSEMQVINYVTPLRTALVTFTTGTDVSEIFRNVGHSPDANAIR